MGVMSPNFDLYFSALTTGRIFTILGTPRQNRLVRWAEVPSAWRRALSNVGVPSIRGDTVFATEILI